MIGVLRSRVTPLVALWVFTEELQVVGAGLLLIGGVVVMVGVAGCVGAAGENRFLLLMYLVLLLVLVLGQLFVTLLLLVNREKVEQSLDQTVDQIIYYYGNNRDGEDRLMDSVQRHGACCGQTGPSDWLNNSFIQSLNLTYPDVLPCSCFSSYPLSGNSSWCSELLNYSSPLYGQGNSSHEQGCKEQLSDWLQKNALTIIGMDVALMFIQVVQFVITVYLYRTFGRKLALKRSNILTDVDHTHFGNAHLEPAHLDPVPGEDLYYGAQNYGYMDPDHGFIDHAHQEHHHDYPNFVDPTHLVYHHDN
ncbi:hypothetical protein L3Q82_002244 [Scortum barcoo]|uniref:Uncharacterized protein n=1 Tax=Scortum barcoo TaxID=214431 RepID=A0ACB8VY65_9TELE|nr:hypothetical protein L3Q82_002244 [Scortum barcoo]